MSRLLWKMKTNLGHCQCTTASGEMLYSWQGFSPNKCGSSFNGILGYKIWVSSPTDDIHVAIDMRQLRLFPTRRTDHGGKLPRQIIAVKKEGRRGRPGRRHSVVRLGAGGMPFSNVSHACMNSGPAQSVGQTVRTECGGEGKEGGKEQRSRPGSRSRDE